MESVSTCQTNQISAARTVTETLQAMHGRHANNESEQIIDERVERAIDQRAPWQVSD